MNRIAYFLLALFLSVSGVQAYVPVASSKMLERRIEAVKRKLRFSRCKPSAKEQARILLERVQSQMKMMENRQVIRKDSNMKRTSLRKIERDLARAEKLLTLSRRYTIPAKSKA